MTRPVYSANVPPSIQIPGKVQTRIGTLKFFDGLPDRETVQKVYDNLDFARGVEAFLNGMPAASVQALSTGFSEAGFAPNQGIGITETLADARALFLTPNSTVIYLWFCVDVKNEPMVVEVPPGVLGIIDLFIVRAFVKDGDVAGTVKNAKSGARVYPLSVAANPPTQKFVNISGLQFNTVHANDFHFYEELNEVVQHEPANAFDPETVGLFAAIGIKKGKLFAPDARQRAILEDAARIGDAMARTILFDVEQRISGANAFSGTYWNWVVLVEPDQETDSYSQIDERLHYTYGAIYTSPFIGTKKAGAGSTYVQAFKDKDGNRLDGGKSYRLHVPANVPTASFWSLTLYDTATRSIIQNPSNDAAHSSYDKLKTNADGSIDLYFAPQAPTGWESNWIEAVPGKGFYPMFRFYAPKESLFDGTWKLPDIELMK